MSDRREFLKQIAILTGGTGLMYGIPPSIQRAIAIDPEEGSTYLDAEHVVILMKENRSFDHALGSLSGVRGFKDPRAVHLPNQLPVWLQSDNKGNAFVPFRLNLRETKSTWMGALPHDRNSQVDSYNEGRYDTWIEVKKSRHKAYKEMPLTMGYYNRKDLPFNYALADAFTVCDQNFSSGMTSTWPNRLFFFTGTIREKQDKDYKPQIRNELKRGEATWKTFPERLEDHGISWKIYQNDVSFGGGYKGEERSWLSSFSCNPMEFFKQYHIKFSDRHQAGLRTLSETLPKDIKQAKSKLKEDLPEKTLKKIRKDIKQKEDVLKNANQELQDFSQKAFEALPQRERNLYNKAFTVNDGDPDFRSVTKLDYTDEQGEQREMVVPKGDIFHQLRSDVDNGKLPTVSWLTPPQKYSDHPSAPWYGSYYVSEVMDILTKNPEVWKKTIFIMTYDENDGYFDHIPPFTPPNPYKKNSGKCSAGIDPKLEWITRQQEIDHGRSKKGASEGPIGLGYRVPMIIASPWNRGGKVCSEVFDHTSTLQFLEKFLNKKFKTNIRESNISQWRRTVCGNLTAAFSPFEAKNEKLEMLKRDAFLKPIHQAQFKAVPGNFRSLTKTEMEKAKTDWTSLSLFPEQEKGMSVSCALPYELSVEGRAHSEDRFELKLHAGNQRFGARSSGAPFTVYGHPDGIRSYAVSAGDTLVDHFDFSKAEGKKYALKVYGPNGFYRSFEGGKTGPDIQFWIGETISSGKKPKAELTLLAKLNTNEPLEISVEHNAYNYGKMVKRLNPSDSGHVVEVMKLSLDESFSWYDFSVKVKGVPGFVQNFAGRVETGQSSMSDPQMA